MKTFLKVCLIILLALVALKFLPAIFGLGCAIAVSLALLVAAGVSLLAIGMCVALALVALFSPIWLPILAIVGLVMLIKRLSSSSV